MSNRVKYWNFPSYTFSVWEDENPALNKGEMGFELDDNTLIPVRAKVGPGNWNDLPYIEYAYWADTVPVASPIGGATGNLNGKSSIEILDLMLNPYQAPDFGLNTLNNATGGFESSPILEIGQSVSSSVIIQYSLTYPENEWIHLVWTKNGTGTETTNVKCYVNGVEASLTKTRSATRANQFAMSCLNGVKLASVATEQ